MGDMVTTNQLMVVLESMRSEIKAVHECFSILDSKIDRVEERLTEKIEVVDAKVMGLAKRVDQVESSLSERIDRVESSLSGRIDQVEERLSREIAEVRIDLADHRNNTEMHRALPKRRPLKKVA